MELKQMLYIPEAAPQQLFGQLRKAFHKPIGAPSLPPSDQVPTV